MLMAAELVNYRKEDVPIFIQVDYEWVPGKVGKEAVTGLSSVTDCADPMAFSGKGQKGMLTSKGTPVNKAGTILSMRGHMHVSRRLPFLLREYDADLICRMAVRA